MQDFRVGYGYDVHKLVEMRDLYLCGVKVEYELGLLGHSDADVALHALCDALLGAAALGDIGRHFPDTDQNYEGISSILLLENVVDKIKKEGFLISNADITIIAQRPKLMPYTEAMREKVSNALGVDISRVNVKATTTERLGFEGRGEGISSSAVVSIYRN